MSITQEKLTASDAKADRLQREIAGLQQIIEKWSADYDRVCIQMQMLVEELRKSNERGSDA